MRRYIQKNKLSKIKIYYYNTTSNKKIFKQQRELSAINRN